MSQTFLDVSELHSATIFWVEELTEEADKPGLLLYPEDGASIFLCKVGRRVPDCTVYQVKM
jgi:hypothetical protein